MSPTPSVRSLLAARNNVFPSYSGAMVVDGESGIRIQGHIPDASLYRDEIRMSNFGDGSVGYSNAMVPVDPPSYEDIVPAVSPTSSTSNTGATTSTTPQPQQTTSNSDTGFKLPPARFKISPRPEEGNENLPSYKPSIFKQTVLDYKQELSSPFDRATKRSWKQIFIILNGTAIYIHKKSSVSIFSPALYAEVGNLDEEAALSYRPGALITKYTLQGAEVGMATDYEKRHWVIRLRAETDQFLLSFRKLEHMIEWIESISAAIDLSPSLDERSLPRYQTMPRRRTQPTIRTPAQLLQEQQTIIRSQFPHLATPTPLSRIPSLISVPEESSAPSPLAARTTPRPIGSSAPIRRPSPSTTSHHSDDLDLDALRALALSNVPTRTSLSSTFRRPAPSTPSDQKIPLQRVTEEQNLRYARRCMAVLCADAPRQSGYVIHRGGWARIEWDGRRLVRVGRTTEEGEDGLPEYDSLRDEGLA